MKNNDYFNCLNLPKMPDPFTDGKYGRPFDSNTYKSNPHAWNEYKRGQDQRITGPGLAGSMRSLSDASVGFLEMLVDKVPELKYIFAVLAISFLVGIVSPELGLIIFAICSIVLCGIYIRNKFREISSTEVKEGAIKSADGKPIIKDGIAPFLLILIFVLIAWGILSKYL